MLKKIKIELLIALAIFIISFLIYTVLQNQTVYEYTLSKISHNYTSTRDFHHREVLETQLPYEPITPENIYTWDAKIYKEMADSIYSGDPGKLAFYPLYPVVWKLTHIDSELIFIFNYALFVIGLVILFNVLTTDKDYFLFATALILPGVIVYYLPYAESLFLLTFAVAVVGLFKQKYWLFFLGALLFSMTRPAALIFLFVLIATDIRYLIIRRKIDYFFKELVLKTTPFLIGLITVAVIQQAYTNSWTAYFDSLYLWSVESGFNKITDWSQESFGMTVFAIFFLSIPSLFYCIAWGIKTFKKRDITLPSLFEGNSKWIKTYLFNVAVMFIAGNFVYTALTSGNTLNGFYRYAMDIPFFFIVLFLLPERLKNKSILFQMIFYILALTGAILFLYFVEYGGDRFQFTYLGFYLYLLLSLFILFIPHLSFRAKLIIFLFLLIPCVVWHTYLFNMYLCHGWIYT